MNAVKLAQLGGDWGGSPMEVTFDRKIFDSGETDPAFVLLRDGWMTAEALDDSEIRGDPQPQRLRVMSEAPQPGSIDRGDSGWMEAFCTLSRSFRSLSANRLCLRAEAVLVAVVATVA
jgi:hypothetical protein